MIFEMEREHLVTVGDESHLLEEEDLKVIHFLYPRSFFYVLTLRFYHCFQFL